MRTRDVNKESLIQEKAIEMIVKEGLDGFSMQKLAKAANVSPATLYIYYKDRDDLITQLATKISNRLMETSLKGMHPKMSFGRWAGITVEEPHGVLSLTIRLMWSSLNRSGTRPLMTL